jgi:hypothetical protein
MARPLRIELTGGLYHVTSRGDRREEIYHCDTDRRAWLDRVSQQIPFTSYDFWAYLSAGFLLLFAIDQATGNRFLMRDNWTLVQGVTAVSLAYGVGQLVASVSPAVFEKLLVARLLLAAADFSGSLLKQGPEKRKFNRAHSVDLGAQVRVAAIVPTQA